MEASEAACVQSTGAADRDCRTRGSPDISAARGAGSDVVALKLLRTRFCRAGSKAAAEAAAAFRFQDSDLVEAREAVAARFEGGAVAVVAVVGAIGLERCDRFRARHRRILRLPRCRVPHRSSDLCAEKNPPNAA